jgi:hypothetical protein
MNDQRKEMEARYRDAIMNFLEGPMKRKFMVKELDTDRVVHVFTAEGGERYLDKVEMGLLRNTDLERFYVDWEDEK